MLTDEQLLEWERLASGDVYAFTGADIKDIRKQVVALIAEVRRLRHASRHRDEFSMTHLERAKWWLEECSGHIADEISPEHLARVLADVAADARARALREATIICDAVDKSPDANPESRPVHETVRQRHGLRRARVPQPHR